MIVIIRDRRKIISIYIKILLDKNLGNDYLSSVFIWDINLLYYFE